MNFDRFIAIDWSGAKKRGTICMAECLPDYTDPKLILPENWTRSSVFQWIESEAQNINTKMLIGMDFAFAFPYCDVGAYFPKKADGPSGIESLWFEIENICKGTQDFYGGPFYLEESAPFKEYLWYPGHKGGKYQTRLRLTEKNCQNQATTPTTCFKFLGANQVGSGSIAGMRFLHALKDLRKEGKISVWPFDANQKAVLTIVEIFPRLYKSKGLEVKGRNEHETDALTSAKALRQLSEQESVWKRDEINDCAKRFEGWIFGVN